MSAAAAASADGTQKAQASTGQHVLWGRTFCARHDHGVKMTTHISSASEVLLGC